MREIRFRQFCDEEESVNYGMHEANPFHYALVRDGGWHTMQYIGLKDKKGKGQDIYEGDIVRMSRTGAVTIGVVTFLDGAFYIFDKHSHTCIHFFEKVSELKIIGNIYENPELIDA